MALTGSQLKAHTVGEATAMDDGTSFDPDVLNIRVLVRYGPYMVTPINADDSGERYVMKTVNLKKADFSGLTAAQKQALLNLVESKIV